MAWADDRARSDGRAGCQQPFEQIDVGLDDKDHIPSSEERFRAAMARAVRRRPRSTPPVRVGPDLDPGRQPGCRAALMRTAACLALSSLVACASLGKKPTRPDLKPWPEIRPDFRVEALRARMHEYSITFAAEVDLAATAIERRAADSTVRRNALLWRVRAIPEMRKACFRLEPISCPRRRVDLRTPDGSALQRRRGRRRLRHIPTRSRRGLASTRRPDAGDRRFDRRVS